MFQTGKEIDRLDGANAPVLTQKVKQHAGSPVGVTAGPATAQPTEVSCKIVQLETDTKMFCKLTISNA